MLFFLDRGDGAFFPAYSRDTIGGGEGGWWTPPLLGRSRGKTSDGKKARRGLLVATRPGITTKGIWYLLLC